MVPEQHIEMVKYFALIRLVEEKGVGTVCGNVGNIAIFLRFMADISLSEIQVTTASWLKKYLDRKGYSESSRSSIWSAVGVFLNRMSDFEKMKLPNPFYNNPYQSKRLVDQKYVPKYVAKQLGRIFMEEDIPVTMRCIYWLLRLIPSRISEILGMKIECPKPFDGHYCLFIPMWKQNGGYKEPIMCTIHIENKEIGGQLSALIQEQQIMAMSYQCYLPKEKNGALFAYQSQILQNGVWYSENRYSVASWPYISYQSKEICRRSDVRDENGVEYVVTSHQFRHNGVTERLKAEGRSVTITVLVEFTGLSRSVFSKEHIRELLVDYGYSGKKTQGRKKSTKKAKLTDIVAEKDRKIQELRAEKEELESECELLRGRIFLLIQEKNNILDKNQHLIL